MVLYLGDDEVSKVQGSVVEVDEDVVVTEAWDLGFLRVLEAIKPIFALEGPLFGSCW